MDAAKLQDAMDYGTQNAGFALRVYRHGCLVAEDRLASANRTSTYESWSMAKSVTSLVFGRAMQLGLVSPDDPVGSLVPEADGPHGTITLHDLLTMTSGLQWNGLRDYNIFTMPDRIQRRADARHRPPARHLLRVRAERRSACSPRRRPARSARTSRSSRRPSSWTRSASSAAPGTGSATRPATSPASMA